MSIGAETISSNRNEPSYLDYKGKYTGIKGWLLSTDHKRIGLLYLMGILTFFFAGATFWGSYAIRINLAPEKL